jgi:hypothetical protein
MSTANVDTNAKLLGRLVGLEIVDIRKMSQEEFEVAHVGAHYKWEIAPTVVALSDGTYLFAEDGADHGDIILPGSLSYATHGDEEVEPIEYRWTPADRQAHETSGVDIDPGAGLPVTPLLPNTKKPIGWSGDGVVEANNIPNKPKSPQYPQPKS